MAFWSRKKEKSSESGKAEGKSFKDFIEAAGVEAEGLMTQDPGLVSAVALYGRHVPGSG